MIHPAFLVSSGFNLTYFDFVSILQSVSSVLSSSTSSVPQSCRSNGGVGDINDSENGLEEPQWVRHCLSRFQATEQQQQGRSTSSAGQAGIACWRMEDSMAERLLSCLANATPYPRLVDAARCALMVCEQRDAACAHREAEVLVLKASLAEVKAAGDQLQCRLEQIESSWCAASRAADLADLALETNNVLVHVSEQLCLWADDQIFLSTSLAWLRYIVLGVFITHFTCFTRTK